MDNGTTAKRNATLLRDREAWKLRLDGLTQAEIAERLGVSQPAVHQALRRVSRQLTAEFVGDARLLLAAHSERLERTYHQAMLAWEKSKSDQVIEGDTDAAGTLTTTRTRKSQHGDAGLLNVALKALGEQRRLWGLDDAESVRSLLDRAAIDDQFEDGDE